MKKIAFCISGLFKPSSTPSDAYNQKFNYLVQKIKNYNADTFIFSFSKELEEEIINIFNPVSYKFELQKSFEQELNLINKCLDPATALRAFSFFFSRKKVCEIKNNYEKQNNFEYDIVALVRPDLGYIYTQNYKLPDLDQVDGSFLYSMNWNQLNAGIADWYFVSNSKNINFISLIYDRLTDYLQEGSKYEKCITSGLPYSNSQNRFSQELFNSNPQHTEKFNKIDLLNHHVLLKYYLLENNKFTLDNLKFYP